MGTVFSTGPAIVAVVGLAGALVPQCSEAAGGTKAATPVVGDGASPFPHLSIDVYSEARGDYSFSSGSLRDFYGFAGGNFALQLSYPLTLTLGLGLGEADDERKRSAPGVGLAGAYEAGVNALLARYSRAGTVVRGGYYAPQHALSFGALRGLYTSYFADDYFPEEGVGGGTSRKLVSGNGGVSQITASVDALVTQEFTAGEELRDWLVDASAHESGERIASFLASTSARFGDETQGLNLRGALLREVPASERITDQIGAWAGLEARARLSDGWSMTAGAEAATFAAGSPVDLTRGYLAGSASFGRANWQVSLGYALRDRELGKSLVTSSSDRLLQASIASYRPNDVVMEAGYGIVEEFGELTHQLGVRLVWQGSFTLQ